jgi:hypothetical protein
MLFSSRLSSGNDISNKLPEVCRLGTAGVRSRVVELNGFSFARQHK